LIGLRFTLGDDELDALRQRGIQAEVSDLSRPENRFERRYGKLLEVYLGLRATDGTPVLFEVYERFSSVVASGQRLWRTFLPPMVGTMVLLELVQIPLAASLARRLQRRQQEREALLQRAIDASELERRRIARDLHDGPVQDLAGVSYTLAAAAEEIDARDPSPARDTVREAARQTRRSIRALRTLLVDIYPPRLHTEGLSAALADLMAPVAARGLEVELEIDPHPRLPGSTEAVLFRAAQEAVRNILIHAEAHRVTVRLSAHGSRAMLEVQDDGRGFSVPAASGEGHFGLRMLEDLARDGDGDLTVESWPGAGTVVRFGVPLR
jgi:signal transduction histidine kinase